MNDVEILTLAAKAAGYIEFSWVVEPRARAANGVAGRWNPRDDDGDMVRLALKLGISITFIGNQSISVVKVVGEKRHVTWVLRGDGEAANLRRAVCMIAARMAEDTP